MFREMGVLTQDELNWFSKLGFPYESWKYVLGFGSLAHTRITYEEGTSVEEFLGQFCLWDIFLVAGWYMV